MSFAVISDKIAALKSEITEIETLCKAFKLELDRLTVVPPFIETAMKCLVDAYGENAEWEGKIALALQEHLKCVPKYEKEYEYNKRGVQIITNSIEYIWDDMKYVYCHISFDEGDETFTYFGDSYHANNCEMGKAPLGIQDDCVEFKTWDDLGKAEHFEMKYLPILIAYLEGELPLDE